MERRILVAEDSPTQAEHLRLLLEGRGYRVDVAGNGREGLELARAVLPDLVISDVVMPEMDGYAFCRAMKSAETTRRIPFVLLTERRTPADILLGLEQGADNFITKPFEDDYLLERVRRIFEHLELRRQGPMEVKTTIRVGGRDILISADKQQIIELLFATFEELSHANDRLAESRRAVEEYSRILEARVQERTKQLREAEAKYRMLVEEIPAVTYLAPINEAGSVSYISPMIEPLLCYSVAEWRTTPHLWRDLLHPDDRERVLGELARCHASSGRFRAEYRLRSRDGRTVWFSDEGVVERDEVGHPAFIRGFMVDITERKRAEEVTKALAQVARELVGTLDLTQATDRVVSTVRRLFRVPRAGLFQLERRSGALICVANGEGDDARRWIGLTLPAGTGVVGRAIVEGRPIWSPDVLADPRITYPESVGARVREEGYRSVVGVPLTAGGETLGALFLGDAAGRVFTEDELQLQSAFADQAALALRNAQLHTTALKRVQELAALVEVNRTVTGTLDIHGGARAVLEAAQSLLPGCAGRLHEMVPGTDTLRVVEALGFRDPVGPVPLFRVGEGLVGRVAATGETVVSVDLLQDDRLRSKDEAAAEGLVSGIFLPLRHAGVLYGTLNLFTRTRHEFPPEEVHLLESLAAQAAVAIANAQLFAREQAARAEAEASGERFRSLVQGLDAIVWESNAARQYTFVSERAETALGYPVEQWLAEPQFWATHVHPDDRERILALCQAATAEGRDYEMEYRFVASDGRVVRLHDRVQVGRDAGGHGQRLRGVMVDVTERKRAEEELQRQREILYQSEKLAAMGQLLAGVAHELNNPLSVVMGRTTFLREMAEGGPLLVQAEKISQAAERCVRIVRNFLMLARQRPLERQPVAFNQVVQEALELVAYPLRVNTIEVVLDLASGLPILWADPHQLHQVVVNLITNARQAMCETPGPRRLTLTTRHDPAQGRVSLEVADTGPGIPPAIRSRIFEPFFTTKPLGQGTGLGLPLCQGIIEGHRGTIRLESRSGPGAVFRIELPVEAPPVLTRETRRAEASCPLRGKTILVVDDEPEVGELLADLLHLDGHQVDTVVNGALALDRLRERGYDLILTDIRMPELDGPGLYREIVRCHPGLPRRVIFLTGDELSPQTGEFLMRVGAPCLSKPFAPDEVRRVVQQTLQALDADSAGGAP
ncbi:MAG: response regulator [Deltaproteobacteria bacterium]|nr:response regulator [Deltaproteobacteria bacterium]